MDAFGCWNPSNQPSVSSGGIPREEIQDKPPNSIATYADYDMGGGSDAKGVESDDEDDREETLPPVENPSTDICGDFEDALADELYFKGSFHFEKDYPDAPNPLLRLEGLGYIGLPLSEVAAESIISCSRSVRSGNEELTINAAAGNNAWELDASKIHLDNPSWTAFMARIMQEVCVGLGVEMAVSQPRCDLHKLILCETGSTILLREGSEKAAGTFATVIVLLPSPFTGGEVQISHAGDVIKIEPSSTRLPTTSILSWYSDVARETKPIQSGYRLALSYGLVPTTKTLTPSIPPINYNIVRLRHVLQSWRQNLAQSPEKIVYLLDHDTNGPMRMNALQGADAHRVALLQSLGTEYGFHLGLATAEVRETGSVWIGRSRRHGRRGGGWGTSDEEDDDDDDLDLEGLKFEKDAEIERELFIKNLVDLTGKALVTTLPLQRYEDEEGREDYVECVPAELLELVANGVHDRKEYECDDRDSGTLTRWCSRVVLVIWPVALEDSFILRLSDAQSTVKRIETSMSAKPSKTERSLIEEAISIAQQDTTLERRVLRALCSAATRWGMLDLWLRVFDACHGNNNAHRMKPADIASAIEAFGIEAIGPSVEQALHNESSNTARLHLLHALEPSPDGEKLSPFQEWDIVPILDAARSIGELSVIEGVVLQVKCTASTDDLFALAMEISKETPALLFRSPEGITMKRRLVGELLTLVINNTNYFPSPPRSSAKDYYSKYQARECYKAKVKLSPERAIQHLQLCLQTNHLGLTVAIARKLVSVAGMGPNIIKSRAQSLLVPLLPRLKELARLGGVGVDTIPGFRILYLHAVPLMLDMAKKRLLNEEDIAIIFEAADMGGGLGYIANSVVPKIKSLCVEHAPFMLFVRKLKEQEGHLAPSASELQSVSTMVEGLVKTLVQLPKQWGREEQVTTTDFVEFAWEMGLPGTCNDILSRLLLKEPRPLVADHVSSTLVPSIKPMMSMLTRHGIAPTTAPFASYFKKVILGYVDLVLGRRPPNMTKAIAAAQRITCKCTWCQRVAGFIGSSHETCLNLYRIGHSSIRHLERELYGVCKPVARFETLKTTSPHSLEVIKTDVVQKHLGWKPQRSAIVKLMKSITTQEPVLLEILGEEGYRTMLDIVGKNGVNAVLPATEAVTAPTPATGMSNQLHPPQGAEAATAPASIRAPSPTRQAHPAPRRPLASISGQASSVDLPPRKKRKTGDVQVIDLTSP